MKIGDKFIYQPNKPVCYEYELLKGEMVEIVSFSFDGKLPRVKFIKGFCPYHRNNFITTSNNLKKINNHPHTNIFK